MICKAILNGRLTADPDEYVNNGKTKASFTIASGMEDAPVFMRCEAWEKIAMAIIKYCHKGDMVSASGRIVTKSYDDKNGNHREFHYVQVTEIDFMTPKKEEPKKEEAPTPTYVQKGEAADDEELPF